MGVDDVASRDITMAMMAVLKTTTYSQGAEFHDAVDSFCEGLHLALHEVIQNVDPYREDVVCVLKGGGGRERES